MKQFWTHNFKYFLFGGIAIVALLMWKGCGDGKEQEAVDKFNQLQHEKDSIYTAANSKISILAQDNDRLHGERDSARKLAEARRVQIATIKPRVIRLAGEVIVLTDSLKCDSLANFANDLIWLIDDYVNQQTLEQMRTDSIEANLNGQIGELNNKLAACDKALNQAAATIPAIKPRGSLYAGGSVIGNKTTIFNGYGAGLAYVDKKGALYGADVLWVNGQQQLQVSYKRRLSFKRH